MCCVFFSPRTSSHVSFQSFLQYFHCVFMSVSSPSISSCSGWNLLERLIWKAACVSLFLSSPRLYFVRELLALVDLLRRRLIAREPGGPTVHPPSQEPSTMVPKCTLGCPEHNLTCSPDSHWDALELQPFAQGYPLAFTWALTERRSQMYHLNHLHIIVCDIMAQMYFKIYLVIPSVSFRTNRH